MRWYSRGVGLTVHCWLNWSLTKALLGRSRVVLALASCLISVLQMLVWSRRGCRARQWMRYTAKHSSLAMV